MNLGERFRYWYKGWKLQKAEQALLRITELDGKNEAAFNRLGILYARKKDYKKSVDNFTKAHNIKPSASTYHNLGLLHYEMGEYKQSVDMFKKALSLEADLSVRHIAYAKVLQKLGRQDKMIHHIERAFQLEPSKEMYGMLHNAYKDAGEYDKAAKLRKAFITDDARKAKVVESLVGGTKQLLENTRDFNRELDRIAAKHGL